MFLRSKAVYVGQLWSLTCVVCSSTVPKRCLSLSSVSVHMQLCSGSQQHESVQLA